MIVKCSVACCVVVVAAFSADLSAIAQAASSQETLTQSIADLQKAPADTALREKIIKLAQEMTQLTLALIKTHVTARRRKQGRS